jgi:signal transduction histidine kinase
MSEEIVCRRCGYAGSDDARYCARCGRRLTPPRMRLAGTINRSLENLPSRHIGLFGLATLIPISILTGHLIVTTGLCFWMSYVLLALIVGLASAYVGWLWDASLPNRSRLGRMLIIVVAMAILLAAIPLIDRAFLDLVISNGQTIALDIPGIHIEAVAPSSVDLPFRHIIVVDNPPPYWLVVTVYALLVAVAGNLTHKAHARLTARERQVRDLRQSLLARTREAAIQQERNRLARELHDSIKQQIFSISMGAAAVEARWEADPQGAQEALGDVRRSAREAMAEMNALLQQLSPAPLEKVGLVQALRDQCEALGYRTGAEVTVEFGELPPDDWLPAGAQESIFRIVQEALSNVARHARAAHVRLYMGQREADGALTIEIQDDGQGFKEDEVESGMGLDNIRQRVQALGGKLTIESAPTEGTTLHVAVPLAEPLILPEETAPNHTLNKVFLTGLAGGLALIAALFYPLYGLVPGNYVAGWPAGSPVVGSVLQIAAVLLVVGSGFLAARWIRPGTRQVNTLWGALASAVAGAVAYFGIIAPTACLIGGRTLLERGLIPADGRADAVHLLAEAVMGIIWWAHGTFWGTLLAGTGLGAIGGLPVPSVLRSSEQPDLRPAARIILTALVIVSALSFVGAAFLFGLFEPTIQTGLLVNGVSLERTYLVDYASDWLIGTPMLFYIVSLVGVYLLLRAQVRKTDDLTELRGAEALAALLGFISFSVPVCLATISTISAQGTVAMPNGWIDVSGLLQPGAVWALSSVNSLLLIIGIGSSLVMGGSCFGVMGTAKRRQHRRYLLIAQSARLNFRCEAVPFGAQRRVSGVHVVNLLFEHITHDTTRSVRQRPRKLCRLVLCLGD